jgi:CRP-like cAMP-binding protein
VIPNETFLGGIGDGEQHAILAVTTERTLAAGDTLLRHGDVGTTFAVLLAGRFKLVTRASNGRRVLLGLRGPGDLIGEIAILDAGARTADAIAVEAARVAVGSADALRRVLAERPTLMAALCRSLAHRLREADEARVEMAALSGNARVAGRLLEMSSRYGRATGGSVHIELPLSQEELADWIGLSRPAVARALGELRAAGMLATGRLSITLIDPAAIREYVRSSRGE